MSRDEAPALGAPPYLYLDPDDAEALAAYAAASGLVEPGDRVKVSRPGEGNMNLTLRLQAHGRSWIVKQSRPWVEKYPSIAAPADRALVELAFYQEASAHPEIGARMPKLIAGHADTRVVILEDLGNALDFTDVYAGASLSNAELDALISFLQALHAISLADPIRQNAFLNRDMRALNHEHIFRLPLEPDNGLDLDAITHGLGEAAAELKRDPRYRSRVSELGERYLADGPCLVHGDYFPGSWLRTEAGIRIIDPEFCHMGEPAFDLGVLIAHLKLGGLSESLAETVLESYGAAPEASMLARRFAGAEIMRRLIGVAQLPLRVDIEEKRRLLQISRSLVLDS